MLARLSLLFAIVIGTMPFASERAIASPDIGGSPVRAITPQATYSTIYSQTNFVDSFGNSQTFILINPDLGYDRFEITHPPVVTNTLTPQTIIAAPVIQTVISAPILQTSIAPFRSRHRRSTSCGTTSLTLSSGRTLSFGSGLGCW